MVHDSTRNLRLDRRLLLRRDWITPEELDKELASLPDVSEKGEVLSAEFPAGEDESPEEPS